MFCRGFSGSGYGHFGGYGGGGMFIMMGLGFLIFLALVFTVFKLMKNHPHSNLSSSNNLGFNTSALNILNERLAKGEIDEEEYAKKKIILNQKN
ncbi:SHOCT domain-containing protein [Clostridium sp.]|uniref:SHOCT domain-containing protein n=1 Tax=Clostridium sp. TaxID=1506 RepID=UPI001A639F8B|nr:SHOCT domain-containing protein [Clostridium sp.]MBK5241954.1 SHOCT domain-containing protein [Clostridium sp.]